MIRIHSYTLMEMIVVTAVIVMIAGVATINFSKLRLDKSPTELSNELRRMGAMCRRCSIAQGKPHVVHYYHEKRLLRFDKESISLPEGTKLLINGTEPEKDLECMKFFPDGNAAAVIIEFASGEEIAGIKISPLTGLLSNYEKE